MFDLSLNGRILVSQWMMKVASCWEWRWVIEVAEAASNDVLGNDLVEAEMVLTSVSNHDQ